MSEKYIIGVDGSERSRIALNWGLERAQARNATVELLFVADDSFLSESAAFLSEAQRVAEEVLDREIEHARNTGFTGSITGKAVVGHPVHEVEEASKHADLLVLGSHTGSKHAGTFFGTRAVKIAAVAHCPVAVVPVYGTPPEHHAVVVGVDGSPSSVKAVAFAAEQASLRGVPLIAVYAWMAPLTPGLEYLWSEELVTAQEAAAKEALAIGTAGLAARYPDLNIEHRIVQGTPVSALLEAAEEADLIVVGSRGRGGLSRLLLGSVSHAVLQALPRTTVVTRA